MLKITSFKLTMLMCLGLYTNAALADTNDDFINNLLTDLAPLITLFGEKVVMQFMSQSMGLADCVALAMAPIGVITIVVSAIRVAGPTWLKAIIGRARENLSAAEIELMSSTSNEACELWNGNNVVRCPGSGKILQFIWLVPKPKPGEGIKDKVPREVVCMTLAEAEDLGTSESHSPLLQKKDTVPLRVSASIMSFTSSMMRRISGSNGMQSSTGGDLESGSPSQQPDHNDQQSKQNGQRPGGNGQPPENNSRRSGSQSRDPHDNTDSKASPIIIVRDTNDVAAPNVSLNCHNRHDRTEIILVAALGVLIQIGVLVYCGFATRNSSLRHHLLKNDKPVQNYAFPLTVSGTIVLTIGVLICGIVVERSTDESYHEPDSKYSAYVIWLQKESTMSDQEFKPFAIYPTSKRDFITTSRRSPDLQSRDANQKAGQGHAAAAMTGLKFLTTVGCMVSVVGFMLQFMGLRGMNYTASVAQFSAMAIMTILRTVVRRGLVEAPKQEKLLQGFELDWLANSLAKEYPIWTLTKEDQNKAPEKTQETGPETSRDNGMQSSNRISQEEQANVLNIRRDLGNLVQWRGPASHQADMLSEALEIVGSEILGQDREIYEFDAFPQRNLWRLKFSLEFKDKKWNAQPDRLEAAISLWVSFMRNPEISRGIRKSDGKDDRLRVQRTQRLGLRVLGETSQSHILMRSLEFHVPANLSTSIPEVLSVKEKAFDNVKDDSTLEDIPSDRVVGCDMEACDQFPGADSRYFDVSKAVSMDAPEVERWSQAAGDSEPSPATEPTQQNTPDLRAGVLRDHLAVYTQDGFERLFARQIFFAFMKSLSAVQVGWGEDTVETSAKKDSYDWHALKINNKKLSGLVSKIRDTEFLSLEEAYFDVIAPLSLSNALPGNFAVLHHIQRQASQCIKDSNVRLFSQVLESLFRLAVAFDNNDSGCMVRAVSIFQYYRELANYVTNNTRKEGRSVWFEIEDLEENFVRPFEEEKGVELSALCSVFDGQFSMWSNLFRPDWSNVTPTGVENDKAFKLTEFHTWALDNSSEYPPDADESSWLKQDIFGWTPIHYLAASGQHTKDLRWSLKYGFEKYSQDQFGFTPLHYACLREDEKTVQELLDAGAPLDVQQLEGISPLHIAAVQSDTKNLRLLLETAKERGKKDPRKLAEHLGPIEETRLHDFDRRAAVHWAAIYGNLEAVKLLEIDLSFKDRFGWNCLHLAVMHEKTELVEYLITNGGLDVNAVGDDGRTPLHMAIQGNQTKIIELLINKDASTDTMAADGKMPFHEAVDICELSVVERLIKNGAKINIHDKFSDPWNPLHYAVRRGDLDILERLLETDEGREASRVKSGSGDTLLHLIAYWCWHTAPAMAEMVSKHLNGDVNPQNDRGDTPLHKAVAEADLALTKTLLDLGATKSLFLLNREQKTPLSLANAKFKKQQQGRLRLFDEGKDWSEIVEILKKYEDDVKTGQKGSSKPM